MHERTEAPRSGYAALLGRPNVGKSTLLNRLIGEKLSITSRKPQTTRHRILGIRTTEGGQTVYVDLPGVHDPAGSAMNRYMGRTVRTALAEVDCIALVVSAEGWTAADDAALKLISGGGKSVVLVVNKIDKIGDRRKLLPLLDSLAKKFSFDDIVPISALRGTNLAELAETIRRRLPPREALYPADRLTDRGERFIAAEWVREQLFRQLGEELPYAAAVEVTRYTDAPRRVEIDAVIWVEKDGQKAIVIGQGGARIKQIGERARLALARRLGKKVQLALWVKLRRNWSDNQRMLEGLGYREDA